MRTKLLLLFFALGEITASAQTDFVAKYNENLKWKTDRPDTNP